MLELKINKEFLKGYRNYKIDILENKIEENILYKVFEHIISKKLKTLNELSEELDGYESIVVCAITGEIKSYNKVNKGLDDLIIKNEWKEYIDTYIDNKDGLIDGWDITYGK